MRLPLAEGVKVTVMEQLAPAFTCATSVGFGKIFMDSHNDVETKLLARVYHVCSTRGGCNGKPQFGSEEGGSNEKA